MAAATATSSAIARDAARGTPRRMDKRTTRSATVRRHRSAVRLEATSEAATAETNAPAAAAGESFDWFSAWYPLRPVSFLDANEPNELRVLGKKLVAYLDPTCKEWRVLEDSCPHRRAPLSLGYVQKDGTLACRYHGWAFDGKDGSVRVHPDVRRRSRGKDRVRIAAILRYELSEPRRRRHSLGVADGGRGWPSRQRGARRARRLWREKARFPGSGAWWSFPWVTPRRSRISLTRLTRSGCTRGTTPKDSSTSARTRVSWPMTEFSVREGTMQKDGFVVEHGGYNKSNVGVSASRVFTAPCSSRSEYLDAKGKKYLSAAILYAPTEPGRTLMFTKFQAHQASAVQGAGARKVSPADRINSLVTAPATSLFDFYVDNFTSDPKLVRVGLSHGTPPGSSAYNLGDQDILAMHGVEVEMELQNKPWKQSYYLPTPADAGVSAFRNWMDKHAGGKVAWAPGVVDDASKVKSEAEQLDRYHRHTKHCVACKTALSELGVLEERCVAASKYLLAGGLFLAVTGAAFDQEAPAIVATCLAGASLVGAEKVRDMQHEFLSSVPRRGVPKPKLW